MMREIIIMFARRRAALCNMGATPLQTRRRAEPMTLAAILLIAVFFARPVITLAQGPSAQTQELISAGLVSAPTYIGNHEYQTSVFHNFSAYDRWNASLRAIDYALISKGGWQAGLLFGDDFGREAGVPIVGNKRKINDIGDIDDTLELGGFLTYAPGPIALRLELRKGMEGVHDGLLGKAKLSYRGRFSAYGKGVFFSVGPAISYGDDAYSRVFLDYSAAATSGMGEYDVGNGLKAVGLQFSAMTPLVEKISLLGFVHYDRFTGEPGESTLVSALGSKDQVTAGISIKYRF